ncbi:MAG: DUF2279 domain-containing protein [Bacteroidales bacterium]
MQNLKYFLIFIFFFFGFKQNSKAQDYNKINNKRLITVISSETILYSATLGSLYHLWYKDYKQSNFHTFNDNNEWLQMDKFGHATTAYQVGRAGYDVLRWSGVKENKAVFFGGSLGLIFLSTVESFDGLSTNWGFSWGDMGANLFGSGLFISQQLIWKEQRLALKFSYHPTQFPNYRPDLLGKNKYQSILKDYNGQTYWLSANIHSFGKNISFIPEWLNIAIGYGASGMTGSTINTKSFKGRKIPYFNRTKSVYLSLDIDLCKIKTNNPFLKNLFYVLNFIKIPFPSIEFKEGNQPKYHWIYF